MVGVDFLWTVGFFFSNLLQCVPISANWHGFGYNPNFCINANVMTVAQAWSDIATNGITLPLDTIFHHVADMCTVLILSLPIPSVSAIRVMTDSSDSYRDRYGPFKCPPSGN